MSPKKPNKTRAPNDKRLLGPDGRVARCTIHVEARDGNLAAVKAELEKGVDVDVTDRGGGTALAQAVLNGHREIVQCLLAAGADANHASTIGTRPLHPAAQELRPDIAKSLLDAGAEVDAQDAAGNTALHIAVGQAIWLTQESRLEQDDPVIPAMIQLLVAAGADKERKNNGGESPLDAARASDNPMFERWLEGSAKNKQSRSVTTLVKKRKPPRR